MSKTFRQADSRWGKLVYTRGGTDMAGAGCGPTSMACLIVNNPKYKDADPRTTREWLRSKGYNINGTTWEGITKGLEHFGFVVKSPSSMTEIFDLLDKGVYDRGILNFRAGTKGGVTWTAGGHYVAFSAYKKVNGEHFFYTRDPGARHNDGWHSYEKTMKGLIKKCWVCYLPSEHEPSKTSNTSKVETKNIKGIDVSEHQGSIDWAKVRADGVGSVIIRAGYGQTHIDKHFTKNIAGAAENGLKIGIYWFSYAYTKEMAQKEAQACLDAIAPYKDKITLPVFYDWEYDSMNYAKKNGKKPGKTLITAMNKAFCDKIKAAGYKAGIYYNLDYKNNYIDLLRLDGCYKWYAYYTNVKQTGCNIQQYSSKGKVNGISGNVDMDWIITTDLAPVKTDTKTTDKTTTKKGYAGTFPALPKKGYLSKGDKGQQVKNLQKFLNWYGNYKLAVDGSFGPKTESAVRKYQKAERLAVDGSFGPKSLVQAKKVKK